MRRIKNLVLAAGLALAALPAAAAELVMVERDGCVYCAAWNAEIAPAYPNTAEGRFAPLRRVNVRDLPAGLRLARRVLFTPTFLLVDNGKELARMEGYAAHILQVSR